MDDIYIFGDSISRGHYGIAYSDFLKNKAVIRGYDGATLKQILSYAFVKKIPFGSTLVIQGGTNDVLYDYLSSYENGWTSFLARRGIRQDHVLDEDELIDSLTSLRENRKLNHIFLCNVMIESPLVYSYVGSVNESIRKIAQACDASIIDLSSLIDSTVKTGSYLPESPVQLEKDASYIDGDPERSEKLSTERSLFLSIDGIHPNKRGAVMIADKIDNALGRYFS